MHPLAAKADTKLFLASLSAMAHCATSAYKEVRKLDHDVTVAANANAQMSRKPRATFIVRVCVHVRFEFTFEFTRARAQVCNTI